MISDLGSDQLMDELILVGRKRSARGNRGKNCFGRPKLYSNRVPRRGHMIRTDS